MQLFKIGDRVRITAFSHDTCGEKIGDVGTVINVAPLKVAIFFDNPNVEGWTYFSRWDKKGTAIKEGYITTEQAGEYRCWWVMNDRIEIAKPSINWIE